ncbi:hypothetical protein [Streptomyces sp. NPDC058625]|uniref:hypothetical protein n=1 Tax=Streptomyces sp. NPDC058625 TaxID=3346564 RepID=UPI0036631B72
MSRALALLTVIAPACCGGADQADTGTPDDAHPSASRPPVAPGEDGTALLHVVPG